ncbi:Piso0_000148 [Millerozyma farinosa CBS 7064]|uniref:choline-phosphate cytidylyltransferase n=1 Tax=Pichia sorbitophila (strain ATCC MYA-4447 / BCRC 22081 / CBS 7064 / NBRC 10061 / NRRL Y-12695) TaxID=559304 RepID=G8YT77_PICSO|nr:Piso0_000148 [Millerozyma farinosa CBS 7064]
MGSDGKIGEKRPEEELKSENGLSRTLSMESLAPKLTSLFRKRKRGEEESERSTPIASGEESGEQSDSEAEEKQSNKRRKVKTVEDEEFEKREKELDEALPEELRKYRPRGFTFNIPPKDRAVRIYADGVFDLFHLGHMKQLEQAKKAFPNAELVCGIPSDKETHKRKGLTVLSDKHRVETLRHCRWVDEVIPDAPWCVTPAFLEEHKIDYVAHDDLPYASTDSDDIYRPIKEKGMFLTTQRTEGVSTSDIITKVIRDYDKYLMRNFARGATRKELNVSWLKKNELEFKKHINDFRSYWIKNKVNLNNMSKDLYFEVREYIRGKKSEVPSLLDNAHSDSDDTHSRAASPLTEFASKYTDGGSSGLFHQPSNKSIIANVKGWIKRDESADDDSTNDDNDAKGLPRKAAVHKKPSKTKSDTSDEPSVKDTRKQASSNETQSTKSPKKTRGQTKESTASGTKSSK